MLDDLKRRVESWLWKGGGDRRPPLTDTRRNDAVIAADAQEHCRRGLQCLTESRAADALACFEHAIALSPAHADAHDWAGVALRKLGRLEEAIAHFQRAIDTQPDHVRALTNQGITHLDLGRDDDASDCFNLALAFDPNCVTALLGLGAVYERKRRASDAIDYYERAAAADLQSPVALLKLSSLCQALGKHQDALRFLERASLLAPNVAAVECNLGILLLQLDRVEDAAAHLRRATVLKGDLVEAHFNLGNALFRLDQIREAIACYRQAVTLRPEYAEAHRHLGNACRVTGEPEKTLDSARTALALRPDYAEAQLDMGAALYDLGRIREAITCYERALAIRADYPEAQLNLGLAWLALGDFERGWAGYEWRFRQTDPDNYVVKRQFSCPEWQGEELAGRTLLIWTEQGISDQLLFAGLYEEIASSAQRCTIECAEKLVPLLDRSIPAARVVPVTDPPHPATQASYDFQVAAGSAARWLRRTLDSFPRRAGYLVADEQRVNSWRARLAALGAGLKVGFSWRSGNVKGVRALFSTQLDQWEELFSVKGVHWVCLQYDECEAELAAVRRRFGVKVHRLEGVDYFNDLDEVSALVTSLDLVISAPTAVSVQAAALGVEVWQLHYGVDWQAHGTSGNPWLPTLARYERRSGRSWAEVISPVASQLAARARVWCEASVRENRCG